MSNPNTPVKKLQLYGTFPTTPGPQGPKGDTGATGPQGPKGDAPVKGVDYFTEADKEEIIEEVKARVSVHVVEASADQDITEVDTSAYAPGDIVLVVVTE